MKRGRAPQLIEKTRKEYKSCLLLFGTMAGFSLPVVYYGYNRIGIVLALVGAVGLVATKACAWWDHG